MLIAGLQTTADVPLIKKCEDSGSQYNAATSCSLYFYFGACHVTVLKHISCRVKKNGANCSLRKNYISND